MPILLDDLQQSTPSVKLYTPKFFHDRLTGRGGTSAGLLSAKNNPNTILPKVTTNYADFSSLKREYRTGQTTTLHIPVHPLTYDSLSMLNKIKRPDLSDMVAIGKQKTTGHTLYMDMQIYAISIAETKVPTQNGLGPIQTNRTITQNYLIRLFVVADPNNDTHDLVTASNRSMGNRYTYHLSSNPLVELQQSFLNYYQNNHFDIDGKAILDFINTYEIYDSVVKQSEVWQTSVDQTLDELFENVGGKTKLSIHEEQQMIHQIKYIMTYNIPLDLYRNIYKSIDKHFKPDVAKTLYKQNLNLLLSDTMNNLQQNKHLIPTFTPPTPTMPIPLSVQKLSPQQSAAVMSTEPLILVQSGAGSGKSTMLLGRIDYLTACGVPPEDIMVLSFTNAAADHIKEKNPQVHSMTIASMIHEIYSANFTGHELSSLNTIYNSLEIYFPNTLNGGNQVAHDFAKRVYSLIKNDTNGFTEMNNFIEDHYDEVIQILDKIHQTSLELEIIICYQKIESLVEPNSVTSKFLIMDEVQDNSIFEFIYTLKYIEKHQEPLFIVGDCSQTLYEFRASNPRALNILESSKTFATFQLNVNYRSNQEILDFANILLRNIEANQYANIQLQANSLAKVTEQSFLEKVTFNYHQLVKMTDFSDSLPSIIATEVKHYLDDKLAKGEQVAFLAFTRREVAQIQRILNHQFPNETVVSLVPEKMFNSTIMSDFIKKYWNDIKFVPAKNMMTVISQEIMSKLEHLVYDPIAAGPKITKILQNWHTEQGPIIDSWTQQVNAGQMTQDTFLDLVKENMLQHEIKSNALKQALLSNRNQQAKMNDAVKNANFVLSTIHSAKGLEFDNVVILFKNENAMDEEKKRMYYVALTRAMKSEYVLAYDTTVSPQIQADYLTILEKLHAQNPAPNSPLNKRPANRRIKI